MRHLLKNCTIIDPSSDKYHGKKYDVLYEKGSIVKIAASISDEKATLIESEDLHCSLGWMDIGVHLGEPGHEQRETMHSLCAAARAGGYTDIVVFPNAAPTIETKGQLQSLMLSGEREGVRILPMAPLSHDVKGDNIAEYIDLHQGGAVGYSDGLKPISKSGLLLRALQYARTTGAPVIHHPIDESMAAENNIHEGDVSIHLGMKGAPTISESMVVDRDIRLARYAEAGIVLHAVSSGESVDLIKQAKKSDNALRATVPYLNLLKIDEDLRDFDVNLKVDPPLRSKKDRTALLRGVEKGTIDCIVSNHVPLEGELKMVEYTYAHAGATGLETCFAALNTYAKKGLALETLVEKITIGPRQILGLEVPSIDEGAECSLTVFDPSVKWTYDGDAVHSISTNNPYIGSELQGKAITTLVG